MAARLLAPLLLLLLAPLPPPRAAAAAAAAVAEPEEARCPRAVEDPPPFVAAAALRPTCRASAEWWPAEEVNGEELVKELSGKEECTAVLFYASWCPFSQRMRPVFDDLSSMFPRIKHLAVEQTNVMPAVLSRYGVRSFPSILIACGPYAYWPVGSKELDSLVNVYTAVTGQEPIAYLGPRKWSAAGIGSTQHVKLWKSSINEALKSEPYLAFSILFICLKILVAFFPKFFACIKGIWVQYFRHANLGILDKLTQLLECVPHAVDLRKIWSKWRLMGGAMNTRVWASSLASMSFGERSSSRAAVLD
uniref:Thioredoxin domain-containing protein n=1 Tax=Oryza punctata TaxID=4537 RepID=A0A0E0MNA2_ORYPU